MRSLLCACLLTLGCTAFAGAAEDTPLKTARQHWLKGDYEDARSLYEELTKDAKLKVPATIGMSRALESKGDYDKAQGAVDGALKDSKDNADLLARRAELLYLRGKWEDAEKAAEDALKINKDHLLARWIRAQVYRDRAEIKKADTEFRWFVKYYTERSNADKDITDPDELLIVAQAGAENARWHSLSDQFDFILNEVYRDALKADKNLWQAEYMSGTLLMEKYNRGEALPAFQKALVINPNAAEVRVGLGNAALEKFEIKEAEQQAERALKVNPNLPDALRLRADVHLASGNVAGAMKELDHAREINPRDEETLGRVAACLFLDHKNDDLDKLVKEVEKNDPKPGLFYYELATRLDERRRYDEAEKYYKKAIELRPLLPWSQNSLGLLYMRMGHEKEGRESLDKAFKADEFNVRVSNMRKVLKHLDKYETLKTDHFELRFDPKHDKVLARYVAEYLEDVYADLADKFQYKPAGPILIEIFNNHEMFSGRVVALPDLHTIGACTGRMFAMVAPHGWYRAGDVGKDGGRMKFFNWSRVIRHELVHIFNLEQTHFQVPHWLTEGLAVNNENFPRPQPWNELLLKRVPAGDLMNLDNIDLGFIRPRNFPEDWHMAYCQSQLYVDYAKKQYGKEVVGQLLAAYGDGLETDKVIQKVCKVDKATFEKGYREYLDEVVKTIKARPVEKAMTLQELKEAHEKDKDNPDIAARLAERILQRGDKVEARKLAESALRQKKNHPLASVVKARLLLPSGDLDGAKELLESALDRNDPEPKVLRELGKLYYEAGQFDKAAEICELGRKVEPNDAEWLLQLARIYAQAGDKDKQISVLKDLVPTDADDLEHRKRLARLCEEAGRHAEAEKYAREALEIDIRDGEVRETLLKALAAQKKDAEAERMKKLLEP
jgi:tetratricopeptide (TPR) repeat protein